MYAPSCLLVHVATRMWSRAAEATWRATAERALAPVAVGLTYASGIALARSTEDDLVSYAITAAATVILSLADVNPLFLLGRRRSCRDRRPPVSVVRDNIVVRAVVVRVARRVRSDDTSCQREQRASKGRGPECRFSRQPMSHALVSVAGTRSGHSRVLPVPGV